MNNNLIKWERYSPVALGLEETFKRLDTMLDSNISSYPPYNILKISDTSQVLEIALAGWSKDDIEVSVETRVLNVKVEKSVKPELGEYIHKGLALRTFSRNWVLSDDTEVGDISYVDGLLRIELNKNIPEEHKKRVLPIK